MAVGAGGMFGSMLWRAEPLAFSICAGRRGVSNGQALRPVRKCWQHVVPPVGPLAAPRKRCDWKSTLGSGLLRHATIGCRVAAAEKDLRGLTPPARTGSSCAMTCDSPSIPGLRNFTKSTLRIFSRTDFFGVVAPFLVPQKSQKSPPTVAGRAKKPRVSVSGTRGFIGSNLSRDCDGGVALRRVGIEVCLALPMGDPDPHYGFGTSVGTVCGRGLFVPAFRPSRLGRNKSNSGGKSGCGRTISRAVERP
jgi:hypothetical protein